MVGHKLRATLGPIEVGIWARHPAGFHSGLGMDLGKHMRGTFDMDPKLLLAKNGETFRNLITF